MARFGTARSEAREVGATDAGIDQRASIASRVARSQLQAEAAGRDVDESALSHQAVDRDALFREQRAASLQYDYVAAQERSINKRQERAPHAEENQEKLPWWRRALRSVSNAFDSVTSAVSDVISGAAEIHSALVDGAAAGISALGRRDFWAGVGSALQKGASWLADKATDLDTWKQLGKLTIDAFTFGPRLMAHIITHPIQSLKTAGSFLKSMSDSIGVSDLADGVARFCTGDFRGGLQLMAKGASKLFLEVTGIADAWGAVKHGALAAYCLAKGDRASALKHLGQATEHAVFAALSIGAIAATVATGGAAAGALVGVIALRTSVKAAAKQVLKTAAKEFFKEAGEKLGQELVKEVSEVLTKEALGEAGEKMAKSGFGTLAEKALGGDAARLLLDAGTNPATRQELLSQLVKKAGPKEFEEAFVKAGREMGDDLMKRAGVTERVAKLTEEMLRKRGKQSTKDIASELVESGVAKSEKEALEIAKGIRKMIRNGGKASDAELAQNLTEGIMKPLREHIEVGVREGYEREMSNLLKGLPKSQADELMEAGWKGARKGLNESMEKAVLAGVKKGIKSVRKKAHLDIDLPDLEPASTKTPVAEVAAFVPKAGTSAAVAVERERAQSTEQSLDKLPRVVKMVELDGRIHRQTFVLMGNEQRLENDQDVGAAATSRFEQFANGMQRIGAQMEAEQARITSTNIAADDAMATRAIFGPRMRLSDVLQERENVKALGKVTTRGESLARETIGAAVDSAIGGRTVAEFDMMTPEARRLAVSEAAARFDFAAMRRAAETNMSGAFAEMGVTRLPVSLVEHGLKVGFGASLERGLVESNTAEAKLLSEILSARAEMRGQDSVVGRADFTSEAMSVAFGRAHQEAGTELSALERAATVMEYLAMSAQEDAAAIVSNSPEANDQRFRGAFSSLSSQLERSRKRVA